MDNNNRIEGLTAAAAAAGGLLLLTCGGWRVVDGLPPPRVPPWSIPYLPSEKKKKPTVF